MDQSQLLDTRACSDQSPRGGSRHNRGDLLFKVSLIAMILLPAYFLHKRVIEAQRARVPEDFTAKYDRIHLGKHGYYVDEIFGFKGTPVERPDLPTELEEPLPGFYDQLFNRDRTVRWYEWRDPANNKRWIAVGFRRTGDRSTSWVMSVAKKKGGF